MNESIEVTTKTDGNSVANDNDLDQEKRQRTKVACDYCRKRKSKCDGERPCSKCKAKNRTCVYAVIQKERKKRVKKPSVAQNKNHNQTTIQSLNKRISTLENLLTTLLAKLGSATSISTGQISDQMEEDTSSQQSPSDSDSNNSEDESMDESTPERDDDARSPELLKETLAPATRDLCSPTDPGPCRGFKQMKRRMIQYFGSHSLFFVFSGRFLTWFKARLEDRRDDALFAQLRKMPFALEGVMKSSTGLLTDIAPPTNGEQQLYFAMDEKALVFEVLDLWYEKVNFASFLCSTSVIRELFQRYFYGRAQNDDEILAGLDHGDYLLMNIALALCISQISDPEDVIDPIQYPNLAMKNEGDLKELKARYFSNAIHFYDKVSQSSTTDGIRPIQGISLLTFYIGNNLICDVHINYILVSVLVRLAKEIGLHRVETLSIGDEEENLTKRKLWWFCEYSSTELAFRTGKPMLINTEDVSTLTEADDFFVSIPTTFFSDDTYLKNSSQIMSNCRRYGYQYYFVYYSLWLTRIKQKSYYKLFSITPTKEKSQEMLSMLQEINSDMNKLASLMIPETRPVHYYEKSKTVSTEDLVKAFDAYDKFVVCPTIELQLSYFAHLLAINRLPFKNEFSLDAAKIVKYGGLSLDSARSVLHLAVNFDKESVSDTSLTGLVFYPWVAFCSLLGHCQVMPHEKNSQSDCELLIDTSMKFFARCSKTTKGRDLNNKGVLYDLITRLLLKVLIDSMTKETFYDFYDHCNGLFQHLSSTDEMFPEALVRSKEDAFKISSDISPNSVSSMQEPSSSTATSTEFTSPTDFSGKPSFIDLVNRGLGNVNYDIPGLEDLVNGLSDDSFNYMILNEMNDLPNFFVPGEVSNANELYD
ncbi:HAL9 [[Candida] subhashii]|uniref:HAL9 n=1 Tax=[Candida] subhashii TaxID=561895 RepID=A0A8J5QNZ1_9ASCO|nr:HAL9 [[Candida] subhashii]KAG7661510.1 HAL9 [[Candida] subhashii]